MRALILFLLLISAACTPKGGGTPGSPAPTSGAQSPTVDGTITSGGGNGIDGRMTEMYSKDIESLPEYKRYIVPILRRLMQGRADVLVVYLKWAAKSKTWYFVPKKLPSLPKERIALAFTSTDQLALHSDKEIFIDQPAYLAQTDREKATLLLHEMVMGAKLLMKKLPQKQCEHLSGALDPMACKDEDMMRLAIADPDAGSADRQNILNGRDHESVRAMTVYLMDPKQSLAGSSIAVLRSRLDFNFPWEHILSSVDREELLAAVDRTMLSDEPFVAEESFATLEGVACKIDLTTVGLSHEINLTAIASTGEKYFDSRLLFHGGSSIPLMAKGILDPSGSKKMVDLVTIEPVSQGQGYTTANGQNIQAKFQFVVSRDSSPRVLEFRIVPIRVRRVTSYRNGLPSETIETVEIKSMKPVRCRAK